MSSEQNWSLNVTQVAQIGFVVKDLEKVIKDWSSTFGIGPWSYINHPDRKVASAFVGSTQFEVVQPLIRSSEATGAMAYLTKFLETWGDGIHHVAFAVEDVNKETSQLEAQGAKVLTPITPLGLSSYVESSPNSVVFELEAQLFYDTVKAKGISKEIRADIDRRLLARNH